ncbi:MAG: hypothetical protein ACP5HU_10630 [Phycisphaerae bacterium]
MDKKDFEKLPDIVGVLEEFYGRLGLSSEAEQALLGHVRNIKGQLYQPAQDESFVSGQLSAIRDILRPRAGNELAGAAVAEIDRMLGTSDVAKPGNKTAHSAGDGGVSTMTVIAAIVGVLAGIAAALFGCWLINDGLLGGFVADRKEMGIGTAVLAVGVFVFMTAVRWLVGSALWRTVIGAIVLLSVAGFAASAASRAAGRDGAIDLGDDAELVKIIETGQQTAVPPKALRRARWYESGVEISVERGYRETTLTIPQKYVVPAELR